MSRAALESRDFARARDTLKPLVDGPPKGPRPTVKLCQLMAEIEEAEHGETGAVYEWLQRAQRAPRDPAWVADGMASDHWAAVSPVTGRIDAFEWKTPQDHLSRGDAVEHLRVRSTASDAPRLAGGPGVVDATTVENVPAH